MEGTHDAFNVEPPSTDPVQTSHLWSLVRKHSAMDEQSRRSKRLQEKHAPSASPQPQTTSPKRKRQRIAPSTASKYASSSSLSVRRDDFWEAVMVPSNVRVIDDTRERCFEHFEIPEADRPPVPGHASFYNGIDHRLEVNHIFNDTTDEWCTNLSKEYRALVGYGDINEPEFQRSADLFFKFELRDPDMPKDLIFRTEATPQGSIKPEPQDNWTAPPAPGGEQWHFLIFPDLVYWISLNGFPPVYAKVAQEFVHIEGQRKLSPYLCIEYKSAKKDNKDRIAMNQLGASMLVPLWNRFQLRKKAGVVAGEENWHADKDLKVYGVRVLGGFYDIWIMKPLIAEGDWQGAEMKRLRKDDLLGKFGVQALLVWINEIHRWGLTVHVEKVVKDVRTCVDEKGMTLGEEIEI